MKNLVHTLCFLTLTMSFDVVAQTELNEVISGIIEEVGKVELPKITYDQTIEQVPSMSIGTLKLTVNTETNKGKTESTAFMFDLVDIDPHTVVRKADRNMLSVNLGVNNDQPFIRVLHGNQTVGYVSNLQIVVADAERGKSLVYRIQRAISKLPRSEIEWDSLQDAVDWLQNYDSRFGLADVTYAQTFEVDVDHNHMITLTVESYPGGEPSQENVYEFFPHHLDARFLKLDARDQQMDVVIPMKRKEKFIKHTLNGDLQSFDHEVSFPAEDLTKARQVIKTLAYISENYKPEEIVWQDLDQTIRWFESSVGTAELRSKLITITIQEEVREQEIDFDPDNYYLSTVKIHTESQKGGSEQLIEEFYPWHINSAGIKMKVEGNRLYLALPVLRGERFVKIIKDGVQQPFQSETEIYFNDIYVAEKAMFAFRYIAAATQPDPIVLEDLTDVGEVMAGMMSDYDDGRSTVRTELSFDPTSYKLRYHSFETNKQNEDSETQIEFYIEDIRGMGIEVGVDNYIMFVPIQTKDFNKYIWNWENDKQKNFSDDAKIRFNDPKLAQDFVRVLEFLKDRPMEAYKWRDQGEAAQFITDHIGAHSFPKEEVKQEWSFSGDRCSITFRVETNKEKSITGELYEFSLGDLDPNFMEISVSFKKMVVAIATNGGEKLIKSYKNGELQNYQSSVELMVDDADEGRLIIQGLKYLQGFCKDQ